MIWAQRCPLFGHDEKTVSISRGYLYGRPPYLDARASGPGFGWTAPVPKAPVKHVQEGDMLMKTSLTKLVAALGIAGALALTVTSVSFAQNRGSACIPHYDSSGAQTAPYC